jgi:antitoxin component of MazEF toxin-antitoxin module
MSPPSPARRRNRAFSSGLTLRGPCAGAPEPEAIEHEAKAAPLGHGCYNGYNPGMKLRLRRVGNSLGIIIPKRTLDAWSLGEGGMLELRDRSLVPLPRKAHSHEALDALKRAIAVEVVDRFSARRIRAQGLANLHRWKTCGSWVSAYDEWKAILESEDDGALFAAMLGRDERSNRLRQSPPYVGLLPTDVVKRLNEEASA